MFGRKKQSLVGIENELPKDFLNNLNQIGYVFDEKLGEGTYGSVYRCHFVDHNGVTTGEKMAVKHINLSDIYKPKYREPRSAAELELIEEKSKRKKLLLRNSSVWRRFKARLGIGSQKHLKIEDTPLNKELMEESGEQLQTELGALYRANHPNVVRMYNSISDEDSRYGSRNPNPNHILIFTELAFSDLFQFKFRNNTPITFGEAQDFSAQMIRGLAHLHSQGIAHLDLKSENILVFSNSRNPKDVTLKITDFGLAILYPITDESPSSSKFRIGTLTYADPLLIRTRVQLRDDPKSVITDIDFYKADVWSYGCIVMMFFIGAIRYYELFDQNHKLINYNPNFKLGDIYIRELQSLNLPQNVISFLSDIFCCDQTQRKSAEECGRHVWISSNLSGLKQRFPSQTITRN